MLRFITFFFLVAPLYVLSQSLPCGNSGSGVCTPVNLNQNGFEPPDSIECFEVGKQGEVIANFRNFRNLVVPGVGPVTVYYLRIDSILNLPCGICWATNKPNNVFASDESACIKFSGLTNDSVGQYKLKLVVKAQIAPGNYNPQALVEPPGGLEAYENSVPNTKLYLRVAPPSSATCPAVDTSSGAKNKKGNPANCSASSIEKINDILHFSIYPTIFSNKAMIKVFAAKSLEARLYVTDMLGRIVQSKNMDLEAGENYLELDRGNLPSGQYLVRLWNNQTSINTRIMVTD
ncbi:MAG: T9SS type A sorting domain-containing protein [Chitinophagales bacterium]|nr:T9SS type A sorting domain-containing protein [Chitinophagales bacterium]